jgi:hypothetical protein
MRTIHISLVALALVSVVHANAAHAQELDLTLQSDAAREYKLTYEEYRIQELERGARRSRNALIGTSAAAAVGLALVIPVSGQCDSVVVDGQDEWDCTRAGDALLGVGSPFLFGGLTGAVVSGIILGVRKGKLRRLNDSFYYPSTRAVRWDERSSRFVF